MTSRLFKTAAVGVAAAALLTTAACSKSDTTSTSDTTAATSAPKATVTISNQWARESPAMASAGAAYMDLQSATGDKLLKASAPSTVAKTVEIHETVPDDGGMTGTTMAGGSGSMSSTTAKGMSSGGPVAEPVAFGHEDEGGTTTTMMGGGGMTMKPVASIDLPAGQTVQLKPGGYHIMLIDLVQPLKVGDTIQLTLTFEKAGEQQVNVPVKEG